MAAIVTAEVPTVTAFVTQYQMDGRQFSWDEAMASFRQRHQNGMQRRRTIMLGDVIGQCTGRVTGIRVLPTEGQYARLEVSLQGEGSLLDQPFTDFGAYVQTVRPGGVLQGEAHNVMITANGEVADWFGGGVGRKTGPGFQSTYGAYGRFESAQGALARLETVATAIEYDVEEDGSYRWQMWEWTGASGPEAVEPR